MLTKPTLPIRDMAQRHTLKQRGWDDARARFAPGQALISVQGGEIVPGGAPLDLIADKVKIVHPGCRRSGRRVDDRNSHRVCRIRHPAVIRGQLDRLPLPTQEFD